MIVKFYLLFLFIHVVYTKIELNLVTDDGNISIDYSGIDVRVITDEDVELFNIGTSELRAALKCHYGRKPSYVYLKSPTPWDDLYKTYGWEQVSRVLSIHSARLKGITKSPVTVMTKNFINESNKTIKVDTSISHTVQNTLTTSWTKEREFSLSQEIEYGINLLFNKVTGKTGFSYTSMWGKSEEKSEKITIGSTSAVETELQPGQAVTAILSVNSGNLEVEVVHKMSLRGNLAVNFNRMYKGHYFWGPKIEDVMFSGGITNEILMLETIKFGFHVDATLTVYDKNTGELL
ncbi:spherulin-2A-like [Manduca sexta]|uniref:spherulin-2A-like n=1 Tax=Manduca sexta TaxID=7130 RepID=UPI00188F0880|nr:spherulin-2A-like [Manduca sexta]